MFSGEKVLVDLRCDRYQNGTINEGGQNQVPRQWDNETGYNNNPFKRRKKK